MNENKFKPYDRVLVRDDEESTWMCDLYSNYDDVTEQHVCVGNSFCICIPYDGNEALLGTTDSPQPKRWRAEIDGKYYIINDRCVVKEDIEHELMSDDLYYNIGNYFRTYEEAKAIANKIKQLLKGE